MIKKITRSGFAIMASVALLLAGACASSDNDDPLVDDQAEVRPFTEKGYDPTHSAPEVADVNNDGVTDSSTSTPRNEPGTTVAVVTVPKEEWTATHVSTTGPESLTASGSTSTTVSGTTVTTVDTSSVDTMASSSTVDTSATADLSSSSDTSATMSTQTPTSTTSTQTTVTKTETTMPMTSSAQVDTTSTTTTTTTEEQTTSTRRRMRKD